jgi:hypothetical protein
MTQAPLGLVPGGEMKILFFLEVDEMKILFFLEVD